MPRRVHPDGPIAARLVLRTLGAAEAAAYAADGVRVGRFGAGKPLALLAYLCNSPNQSAPREHLVELLWGDVEPDPARHALRQTIWYIRKTLGATILETDGELVHIALPVDSDVREFLMAVDAHKDEKALDLYRGNFLADIAIPGGGEFERWADLERLRLRSIFTRTAESRVLFQLGRGEARAALPVARRARDTDSGDERLWRRVLEVLIAAGDSLGALAEADAFEQLWQADEREPEASTRALLRRARSAIGADASAAAVPSTVGAALVGRAFEFAALTSAWDEVQRDGKMRHVHVSAPAGLGKTRLLTDFRMRLRASRSRTVFVRANPGERAIPFALVAEIARVLAALPGAAAISPEAASVLVRLNPALSSLFPQASSAGVEQEPLRRRTVALRELAAAVTDDRPVALLVDDLHWADRESLAVLAACADNTGDASVLLVTSGRGNARQWFADALREVTLPPLDPRAVTEFISSLGELPDDDWAERLPSLLTGATSGSPLLVLETLQLAMERDLLRVLEGRWACTDPVGLEQLLVGTNPLALRVGRLDDESAKLLGLLSAAGVPCTAPVLGHAAPMSADAADRTLHALEVRGLVCRTDAGWVPAHDEIAASLLTVLGEEATCRARTAVARAVAADAAADLGALRVAAELLVSSGDSRELADVFARFARLRTEAGIRASAAEHLRALVGDALPAVLRRRVLRAAPWRARLTRAGVGVAAALLVTAATYSWWQREHAPAVALHLQGVETDSATAEGMTLDIPASIDISRGTIELSSQAKHLELPALGRARSLVPAPDGSGWYGTQTFTDGGNDDIVFVARDGHLRRLDQSPGDDLASAISPDGGRLAFVTTRFSSEMHATTAVFDVRTRRVTPSVMSAKDIAVAWHPDGSLLLVMRAYRDGSPPGIAACVLGSDGTLQRCFDGWNPMGWGTTGDILAVSMSDDRSLARVDVGSGRVRELCKRIQHVIISPDNAWVLVHGERSGYDGNVFWLAPIATPCDGAVLLHRGSPIRVALATWDVLRPSARWLDRVTITSPDTLSSISPVQLVVAGVARDGSSLTPAMVRWTALDTTIATVSPDGLVVPHTNGTARIVASAGGWRADTNRVVVMQRPAALSSRTLWRSPADAAAWYLFGTPRPTILTRRASPVLSLNGDSSYSSGIRLRETFHLGAGLAVRARVRLRLTANQWQTIHVGVQTSASDSAWNAWDLATGAQPTPANIGLSCQLGFPGGEGVAVRRRVSLSLGTELSSAVAPTMLVEGAWSWLEVQVLPDGRCGVAVDDKPLGLSRDRQRTARPVEAMVYGYSHRTQTLVDTVEVYTGVLHPAWWTALDAHRLEAEARERAGLDAPAPGSTTGSPGPGRTSPPSVAAAAPGRVAPPAPAPRDAGTRPVPPR